VTKLGVLVLSFPDFTDISNMSSVLASNFEYNADKRYLIWHLAGEFMLTMLKLVLLHLEIV
jgi:hypothetical protein